MPNRDHNRFFASLSAQFDPKGRSSAEGQMEPVA